MQEHHKFDIYGFLSAKRGHGSHKCSEMEIVMDYKGKKILVIIPAYNEAENIVQVVEQMRSVAPWCDYLVVNDVVEDCVHEVHGIIQNEHSRMHRNLERMAMLQEELREFVSA